MFKVIRLCEDAVKIVKNEPTLLKVAAPIKVFGDIHGNNKNFFAVFLYHHVFFFSSRNLLYYLIILFSGQWTDLEQIFNIYGFPNHINGDLDRYNYLFLGMSFFCVKFCSSI